MNKAQFHLSGRLAAVAAMVSPGTVIADIGTDHGYVPAYLVGERICPRAVAIDINEGPLRHARQTVLSCVLQILSSSPAWAARSRSESCRHTLTLWRL